MSITTDYAIVTLSIDPDRLERKFLRSIKDKFDSEFIMDREIHILCQGFSVEKAKYLLDNYPEFIFHFVPTKIDGSISRIRRILLNEYEFFEKFKYLILTDDDFVFGHEAFNHYDYLINEMELNPDLGMIACHRRMSKKLRLQTSPVEVPYPKDLSVISMRTGLIVRSDYGKIVPADIFVDEVAYHEEFIIALKYYVMGYEIGKGWVDAYHQSRKGGLGNQLQKELDVEHTNKNCTAKSYAHSLGYFDINDGEIYYGRKDAGAVSDRAKRIHSDNLRARREARS